MSAELAQATEAYQAYLEGARAHPEDEELERCVVEAWREMVRVWYREVGAR